MQPIVTQMAALAVAMLYYYWRAYNQNLQRRQHLLCQRVAFMLWCMAERLKGSDPGRPAICRG